MAIVRTHPVDPAAAQIAYDVTIDALARADLNRAEAIVGLLTVLGTQFNGGIVMADQMPAFIQDACDWFNAYFAVPEGKH